MEHEFRKESIRQILLDQRSDIEYYSNQSFITREQLKTLSESIDAPFAKVIIGVRRSGKSVLAHQALKGRSYGYVNFDDERLISLSTEDLNRVLAVLLEIASVTTLLFDEIQNVAGWELFVNRLIRKGYNIIITGSNANLLSKELATHLTGRHIIIEVFPFSFREFLAYQDKQILEDIILRPTTEVIARVSSFMRQYIEGGGFPEAINQPARSVYLRNLYDNILSRDVINRFKVKHIKLIRELAIHMLDYFGSKVSYQRLKETFQVGSVHTIQTYLKYFEEVYMIFQLYPFSYKSKERVAKEKKIYAIDTGVIHALTVRFSDNIGRLMENVVYIELLRRKRDMFYYSDASYEVDFVVKKEGNRYDLIQACYCLSEQKVVNRETRPLFKLAKTMNCDELIIVTMDEATTIIDGDLTINVVPLWKWLLKIG